MGNLKNVPRSKSVISQCRYEYRKAKNTLSSKIAMEKRRNKKQYKGPGYFQQNRKPEKERKNKSLEEWE